LGLRPAPDLAQRVSNAKLLWIAAADPAGDSLDLAEVVSGAGFVVVQDLFLSATARRADVVLPVLPFSEREGSFTNSERRVQRYYPALPQREGARVDFAIAALIGNRLGMSLQENSAARVMAEMAQTEPAFAGISYDRLAESPEQWPAIGRQDVYYGGTSYDNHQGVGATLALLAGADQNLPPAVLSGGPTLRSGELLGVPVDRLFDHGTTMVPSANLLKTHLAAATATLNPQDAARLGLAAGAQAVVRVDGVSVSAKVIVDASLPVGVVLLPRSVGLPILEPAAVEVAAMMLGNDVD
jgi:NADH-quinone oxidoreductase subunit G